jgi:predicted transposase/invertase (TIGR01784 family)
VLLGEDVKIINISDPEGNQAHPEEKFNRVDILVENDKKELLIIEMQNSQEVDYFFRMLFGVSRAIIDHSQLGKRYEKVRKVYHINIVYFELGQGKDYVYHGTTEFRGIHCNDLLSLTDDQKNLFLKEKVSELYPEYYILRVEDFNNVAKDSLDEWIYFLKNNAIPIKFTAKGLPEAREVLQYDDLSEEEKKEYVYHINQTLFENNVVTDSKAEGKWEGLAEGRAEGEKERKKLKQALDKKNKALNEERIKREQLQREIETLKRRFDKKQHQSKIIRVTQKIICR